MIVFEFNMLQNGIKMTRQNGKPRREAYYDSRIRRKFRKDRDYECKLTDELTAVITTRRVPPKTAHDLLREADDFGGYKLMLNHLVTTGEMIPILPRTEEKNEQKG